MSKGSTCLDDPEDWQRLIIDIQLLIFYNLRAFFVIFFFYFLFFFFFFKYIIISFAWLFYTQNPNLDLTASE